MHVSYVLFGVIVPVLIMHELNEINCGASVSGNWDANRPIPLRVITAVL